MKQSTPYYPQSNGQAEAAVKAMKKLIKTRFENDNIDADGFQQALLEWRYTPQAGGYHCANSFRSSYENNFTCLSQSIWR